ncbi:MAG: small multi-drug export protein [Clostridia bacterium]|nr:small multi-drug export protein [Clostridia bacterium]
MTEIIRELVGNDLWATIIMSFVPLIELKGGIVFARGLGFDFFYAFLLAYLGSTLVFFPIYFLLKPILNLIKKIKIFSRIAHKIESYLNSKAEQALEKHADKNKKLDGEFLKKLGVFIFVAIPLPMTGVWTGTAIAVFLNLKFKDAILPVVIGNFVAGLIISILAQICISLWSIAVLDYILYVLFALALILFVVVIIKIAKRRIAKKEQ